MYFADMWIDMVLEDVTELYAIWIKKQGHGTDEHSDYSGGQTKLSKILLNGKKIMTIVILPQKSRARFIWDTLSYLLSRF